MSFSLKDENQLNIWFRAKDRCFKNSSNFRQSLDDYYKYRDLICGKILCKLDDLFKLKSYEWRVQCRIMEDDSLSIIHDSILASVDHFNVESNVKFITYFWKSLNSRVRNYINKYIKDKLTDGGKKRRRVPNTAFLSIHDKPNGHSWDRIIFDHLSESTDNFDSQQNAKFLVEHMFKKLPKDQQRILSFLVEGSNYREIAQDLNLSQMAVLKKVRKIRKRFTSLKDELCRTRKLY